MRGKAGIPLYEALKKIDPNIKDEHQFDWLFLPKSNERTKIEKKVLQALWDDCEKRSESKFPGKICDFTQVYYNDDKIKGVSRRLEVDFYLPKYNLIIELDELQHFTKEREITFDYYNEKDFNYSIYKWKSLCDSYNKKDSDPLTRDWKRAFRDSIRDLRARQNGIPLLRLFIKDFDQKAFSSVETTKVLQETIIKASEVIV